MDYKEKAINYAHLFVNSLTPQDFYALGVAIGGVLATIGLVAYIKRVYLRKNARKLASEFIVLNVAFWSFVSSIAGFIALQGAQYAHLLPYLERYWPTIMSAAIALHAVSTALHKFWQDRKDKKPLTADNLIDGIVDIKTATLPTGVEKVKQPIPQISSDVWAKE